MQKNIFVLVDAYWAYRNALGGRSNPSPPFARGTCTCTRRAAKSLIAVVQKCDIKMGVICAHNIREHVVDMTAIFLSSFRKIEIFNTSIKTIKNDLTRPKKQFSFIMLKENARLSLTAQTFGTVEVDTLLFRIRALKYLDRSVIQKVINLQFFSMNSTKFNLGNRQSIWSGNDTINEYEKLEIRGPHPLFSMINGCKKLRYVEFGIIWSSGPANVIPDGFLKKSFQLETIYIHRSRNFTLPANFMSDLESRKEINMTVNIWNVDSMSLSNQTKILNGINLTDGQRQVLNGFGGEDAKNCKWFCKPGPGAWGHCDDDWDKQNCGICVRNLLSTKQDIPKALRGICFLENSEVISDIKMPPPHPTWAPGDYQPNMGNDYEGVTRRRALGFGATAQVGLIFLIVFFWLKRRYRLHLFFLLRNHLIRN